MTQAELEDLIADVIAAGAEPSSASSDGLSVSAHSLGDRLKAINASAAVDGMDKPQRGLRFTKLRPPGAA